MKEINEAIKDVFGDAPASFEEAVQAALGALQGDSQYMSSEEDDGLRASIIEAFSHVKADKYTVENVRRKASDAKQE